VIATVTSHATVVSIQKLKPEDHNLISYSDSLTTYMSKSQITVALSYKIENECLVILGRN
jgi:hypothetical protein